ncbi:LytR family transcriptional regulator [Massilia sp. Root418]|uniref:LytR/AlgR family response regulator transcription factor n=1 Tax=Massilia sp. Root418 TaxID=1736532 RepID=UPI0006FDFDF4|nr:LytTR family DNA-binding domain-containing protein [Massilia sp. Root418]KQW87490.1 LytR family transcriptional regulator [Massilia sp. Root418]
MTIQVLIAEDEPILAATLAHALKRLWPEAGLAATCPHGADALEKALALQPDVLFLDIKMPGMTGLEAAEELAEQWSARTAKPFPQIVFVTAYDEYAVQAFEREAADYVLKPISDARLGKTIERLKARLSAPAPGGGLEALLGQMRALLPAAALSASAALSPSAPSAPSAPERLSVIRAAVGNQVRMIPVGDVVYFEALDKYVNVVTQDSEALIRMSLKELLPQLDDKLFWQVHRGTIVNAACVLSAVRDEAGKLSLQLKHRSERVRVSPLYAHLFRQM